MNNREMKTVIAVVLGIVCMACAKPDDTFWLSRGCPFYNQGGHAHRVVDSQYIVDGSVYAEPHTRFGGEMQKYAVIYTCNTGTTKVPTNQDEIKRLEKK
jgi:hypothetical protein